MSWPLAVPGRSGEPGAEADSVRTVVVLSGGPLPAAPVPLPPGAIVVTANGGAELARALGVEVALAVGDFDSLEGACLGPGTQIERYPTAKDATDLELALGAAMRFQPERVLVVGSAGGRLDHLLGGLLLLAADAYAGVHMDAWLAGNWVHVVRDERILTGPEGATVSLFALNGPARGVFSEGLVYPLSGETLEPSSTRGVSNVFAGPRARVRLRDGVLMVVRPDAFRSDEGPRKFGGLGDGRPLE